MFRTDYPASQLEAVNLAMTNALKSKGPILKEILFLDVDEQRKAGDETLSFLRDSLHSYDLASSILENSRNYFLRPDRRVELSSIGITKTYDTYARERRLLVDLMTEVLEQKGPLNDHPLAYFVSKIISQRGLTFQSHDVKFESLLMNINDIATNEPEFLDAWQSIAKAYGEQIYLASQSNAPVQPLYSIPWNYQAAYFDLLEKLTHIKAEPDLLTLPDSWLNKVFFVTQDDDIFADRPEFEEDEKILLEKYMTEVLEENGPIPVVALPALLSRKRSRIEELQFIINYEHLHEGIASVLDESKKFVRDFDPQRTPKTRRDMLFLAVKLDQPITFSCPENYTSAYFELVETYDMLRAGMMSLDDVQLPS